MSTFNDREAAFEAKFAHDAEMQFKANARCNKQLGLWAAGLKGETDEAAAEFAKAVVKSDLEEAGHDDVVRTVVAYLGDLADEATIRSKMADFRIAAKVEIMQGHS